jgi:hypothetical protein
MFSGVEALSSAGAFIQGRELGVVALGFFLAGGLGDFWWVWGCEEVPHPNPALHKNFQSEAGPPKLCGIYKQGNLPLVSWLTAS